MNEDEIILLLDYDNICRLCLQSKGALSGLFDNTIEDDIPITDQIMDLTSVKIDPGDGLPMKICHKCRYFMEVTFELRTMVIKSNKLLSIATSSSRDLNAEVEAKVCETVDLNDDKTTQIEIIQDSEYDIQSKGCTVDDKVISLSEGMTEESFEHCQIHDVKPEIQPLTKQQNYTKKNDDATDWLPNAKKNIDPSKLFHKQAIPKHLVCQICMITFKNRSEVRSHAIGDHYKNSGLKPYFYLEKPYACSICRETFSFRKNLISHHRMHLGVTPFKCDTCGSCFRTKQSLTYHTVAHGDRRHVCAMCGASFRRTFELNQHTMRHEDEGNCYPCTSCRVVCSNRISYKAHMRHHELGRRFKCPRTGCPKAYFSQTDLRVHLRAHDNDRCFQCPLCVCSYISQSQLNRHLRRHKKRRVNKCDKCSSTFFDYTAYCNHRISVHGHWHPFKCSGCNQGYQSEHHLQHHMTKCTIAREMGTVADTVENTAEVEVINSDCSAKVATINEEVAEINQAGVEGGQDQPSLLIQTDQDNTPFPTLFYLKPSANGEGAASANGTWYTIVQDVDQEQA